MALWQLVHFGTPMYYLPYMDVPKWTSCQEAIMEITSCPHSSVRFTYLHIYYKLCICIYIIIRYTLLVKCSIWYIDVWARYCAKGDPFLLIQASLSDTFSKKTVRDWMIGIGMAPKVILSRLFNPFNLKILELYLETWLWLPLMCAENALHFTLFIFSIFYFFLLLLSCSYF